MKNTKDAFAKSACQWGQDLIRLPETPQSVVR
jgi:hypothetical protein